MAELKTKLPKYCVIKERPRDGYAVVYFQVPAKLRPAGWAATYIVGRTDNLSNEQLVARGNEYYTELLAARRNQDLKIERGAPRGSMADIIAIYKKSEYWTNLKPATRKSYSNHLATLVQWSEASHFAHISSYETRHISKFLQQWRNAPRTRKYYKAILSILFNIAITEGFITNNIVKELRLPKSIEKKKKLFIWEQSDVEKFVAKADELGYWNAGTAVLLAYETGQRQTDIFNFQTPRDYHNGRFAFETSKTGARIYIPATQRLLERMAQRPINQLLLTVSDKSKRQWTKVSFHHVFREITAACDMNDFIFRQLRNSAAIRSERADLTDAEFEAVFGWPKENVRQMMKEFYGERDQAVADRGIKKMEDYRNRFIEKVGSVSV